MYAFPDCVKSIVENIYILKIIYIMRLLTYKALGYIHLDNVCKNIFTRNALIFRLYRYVTRTNVSFFDPSPNDQRTEHSCA